ncbi:Protein kinase, putative [Hondaea fermentalgiana]|uniref:Protein kinase, putative n=1 Tax=Hondaea fermentalgiana TaxID=2315210 RepID=A0A2R5GJQ5_9STRA|nr:Protein kinase, putative [Hondaea fermentalgiana]|eukprot:GBG29968.1 Protein kinase, putative [Hondaea fermentalgiana]
MGGGLGGRRGRGLRGSSRSSPELCLDDFKLPKGFPANIGEGGFGRVLAMVKRDEPSRRFAVKCMNKGKIIHKGQVENVLNELNILRRLEHYPYLVNLFYAFQDKNNVYMCTDLMLGGTLQRAMRKTDTGTFAGDPERIKLYAAELSLAVQFLHANNVVHRDIKPDNVLLDANGHVHLTDFNVSIYVEPGQEESQKHNDGWGTRGYRAPEVYLRTGAGFIFACDWWSLGSLIFEMFTGRVPYSRQSKDEPSSDLLLRMNAENADFYQIEDDISRDFLRKLLRFDPEVRLGCQHGSNSEVMILAHPFFNGTDWDALEKYCNPNEVDLRGVTSEGSRTTDNSEMLPEVPASVAGTEASIYGDNRGARGRNPPPGNIAPDAGAPDAMVSSASLGSRSVGPDHHQQQQSQHQHRTSMRGPSAGTPDIRDYMDNFDQSLDQKEKLRILQRNMGILGLNGFENFEEDELNYPPLTHEQQNLFKDWQFNVDFKLEQLQMPQYTLLQMVSSMAPDEIKSWVGSSKTESIRALCTEMKSYREQAMKENFDHVMAEMRIDRLIEENLRLTRRVAQLEQHIGIRQVQDDPLAESEFGFQSPNSLPLSRKSSRSSKASSTHAFMAAAEVGASFPDVARQPSMESSGAASTTSAVQITPADAAQGTSSERRNGLKQPSELTSVQGQAAQAKDDRSPTGNSSVVLFDADNENLDAPTPAPKVSSSMEKSQNGAVNIDADATPMASDPPAPTQTQELGAPDTLPNQDNTGSKAVEHDDKVDLGSDAKNNGSLKEEALQVEDVNKDIVNRMVNVVDNNDAKDDSDANAHKEVNGEIVDEGEGEVNNDEEGVMEAQDADSVEARPASRTFTEE